MTIMNVADVLDGAANLIERYGHAKGTHGNKYIGYCAQGAVFCAWYGVANLPSELRTHIYSDPKLAVRQLKQAAPVVHDALVALFLTHRKDYPHTPDWNNAPERTAEDVISTLRACAAIDRARDTAPATVNGDAQKATA